MFIILAKITLGKLYTVSVSNIGPISDQWPLKFPEYISRTGKPDQGWKVYFFSCFPFMRPIIFHISLPCVKQNCDNELELKLPLSSNPPLPLFSSNSFVCLLKCYLEQDKVAQWVEVLVPKPDDVSSILRSHNEPERSSWDDISSTLRSHSEAGENQFLRASLSLHTLTIASPYLHTLINNLLIWQFIWKH